MTESTHTNFSETKKEKKIELKLGNFVLYGKCLGKAGASALRRCAQLLFIRAKNLIKLQHINHFRHIFSINCIGASKLSRRDASNRNKKNISFWKHASDSRNSPRERVPQLQNKS